MTPSEYILRKSVVTQGEMSSADWDLMDTAIKERAFISSRVESVNFLDTCRSRIADLLENRRDADGALVSRARVVSDIMRAARDAGIFFLRDSLVNPLRIPSDSSLITRPQIANQTPTITIAPLQHRHQRRRRHR